MAKAPSSPTSHHKQAQQRTPCNRLMEYTRHPKTVSIFIVQAYASMSIKMPYPVQSQHLQSMSVLCVLQHHNVTVHQVSMKYEPRTGTQARLIKLHPVDNRMFLHSRVVRYSVSEQVIQMHNIDIHICMTFKLVLSRNRHTSATREAEWLVNPNLTNFVRPKYRLWIRTVTCNSIEVL